MELTPEAFNELKDLLLGSCAEQIACRQLLASMAATHPNQKDLLTSFTIAVDLFGEAQQQDPMRTRAHEKMLELLDLISPTTDSQNPP